MIPAAYHRSLLCESEAELYRQIANALAKHEEMVSLDLSSCDPGALCRALNGVHLDHPELFYVNFWNTRCVYDSVSSKASVHFGMLLGKEESAFVANTLRRRAEEAGSVIGAGSGNGERYLLVLESICRSVRYLDTADAFCDHTAAGPVLKHTAVCEGMTMFFLYCCQRLQLPCAAVSGTYRGEPHAWNMVETNEGIRYVDLTALTRMDTAARRIPGAVFRSEEELREAGYRWKGMHTD